MAPPNNKVFRRNDLTYVALKLSQLRTVSLATIIEATDKYLSNRYAYIQNDSSKRPSSFE